MTDATNPTPTDWFPAEAKDYVANKGWKAPGDVLGAYQSLEKLMTADKAGRTLVLPKDEQDAEGLKAFRSKLGVPDAVDGYAVPDAMKEDPLIPEFAKFAHSLGIPSKQFEALLTWTHEQSQAAAAAAEKETADRLTADMGSLKGEWGDKFDANTELAKRAIRVFGGKAKLDAENVESLAKTLDQSASLRRLFAAIGQGLGEHNFAGGGSTATSGIKAKVDQLKADRLAGKISQKDYLDQMEMLGPQLDAA